MKNLTEDKMKFNWNEYIGNTLNVTMLENYGMKYDAKSETPLYEIVFKTGKLAASYDEGLLLEVTRESHLVKIFIPHYSIKCVEIFNV
ncbi:MAG: hypothetical protein ACM34K_15880 [Bacillota bacterium]